MTPTGSSAGSAMGGLARSTASFTSVTAKPADAAAHKAADIAVGSRRLDDASQTAPTTAKNGHFTHHADASTKNAVRGSQRRPSPKATPALSQAWKVSMSSDKSEPP
jgi:hypothetical protein